ncbi:uncharacterized protein LOC142655662 [Rhinoderma darwinii]|uniref:uncharacterized protein LOC142655662 n=1 Tax=Rhinoderma darwinii TaxID=43563 RepID=UPI003F6632ED
MNDKGKSGDGRLKKKPYMYTKQLSFLLDVMQVGPTKENLEEEEDSDETQIEEPDVALGTARSTSTPVTAEPTTVDNPVCAADEEIIPRGKRRRSAKGPTRTEPRQEVDLRVLEHLEKRATETEEGTFCRALSNILKRVPISRQIRCQTALMEVVEIFATHPDPRAMHQAIEFHRRGCDASTFNSVPPAPAATAQGIQHPSYVTQCRYSVTIVQFMACQDLLSNSMGTCSRGSQFHDHIMNLHLRNPFTIYNLVI